MSREKIEILREILTKRKKPISITEIARESNISRATAARYLDQMHLSGQVRLYEIGKAKKYQLASEKSSHNLCDLSTNFVLILDQELRVVFVNEAYLRFSGIIKSEIIGKRIESLKLDIFASSDVLQLLKRYQGEGVEYHNIELSINNSDVIYTITIAKVIFASNKLAIAIIAHDITAKRRLEDQIQFLASIVASSEDGIIGIGLDSTIISWNKGAERLFGYSYSEVIGRNISHIFPQEKKEDPHLPIKKILSGEISYQHVTHQIYNNGLVTDISLTISHIRDHNEKILGVSVIVRDITDLKSIQKALIQSKGKINILSSITRHDILNQLQALDLFVDLFMPLIKSEPKALEYLVNISSCSKNIKEHIQFTRDYQGIGDNIPIWQHIDTMIRVVAVDNLPDTISLTINTGDYEIFADPMLMHVFFNLIENSKRHGKDITAIQVSIIPFKTGGGLLIFEDNGAGIPESLKTLIFEKGIGKNSGLGLFLVREILAITSLEICETGEEGHGARFEVMIPPRCLRKTGDL